MTSTAQAFSAKETIWIPPEPASVGAARTWLLGRSAELLATGRSGDLALVLSEVVTNAVRHGDGSGQVELSATPKPEFLCVQVSDDGPG